MPCPMGKGTSTEWTIACLYSYCAKHNLPWCTDSSLERMGPFFSSLYGKNKSAFFSVNKAAVIVLTFNGVFVSRGERM